MKKTMAGTQIIVKLFMRHYTSMKAEVALKTRSETELSPSVLGAGSFFVKKPK